jgi:hypothetical protein
MLATSVGGHYGTAKLCHFDKFNEEVTVLEQRDESLCQQYVSRGPVLIC